MKRTPLQIALRKRADALRSIETRRRSIAALEARIADLDAAIASLGGRKVKSGALRLPRRSNGETQRIVFDLLRERGTITSADVAARVATLWGLDYADKATGYALRQRAIQALRRLARGGWIEQAGAAGRFGAWRTPVTSLEG